ncbi:hypothetical protein MATL_G00152460 [Megalops atlanticus]|uniref:Transmembrane protein 237 n=1 Tax=Megalops atlanticus TaxID=7932 RepID=A0A9D3PUN8_MEGAT|nr:hypothetical protein MATL_G00152460 [Megalops atlanticus]
MPSQDTGDEMPVARTKKRKSRKETNGVEGPEEPGMEMGGMETGGVDSHRHSESREPLTPEPQDMPLQRKKKKKKAQPPVSPDLGADQEGDPVPQPDLVNGEGAEQHTDVEEVTRKTKKKKKPKPAEMHYTNELSVEDEDIVTDVQPPAPQRSLFSAPPGASQPVDKVFVERSRRFQAANRLDMGKASSQVDDFMEMRHLWTTRDVAMRVHSGFRVVGLFSHGFLAGYAVWNIIVVYILSGEELSTLPNLLQQYHPLAYPAQSLLYLLLAISTVSAFDRVNLAKATMAVRGFLTLDPVALASFLYFTALILSLSQQMTSDRIHLYPTANESLWPPGSEHQILQPWIVVNLVVALLVGLAWVFVSTRPELDYTEEFLMAMEVEEYPRLEEKSEIPS